MAQCGVQPVSQTVSLCTVLLCGCTLLAGCTDDEPLIRTTEPSDASAPDGPTEDLEQTVLVRVVDDQDAPVESPVVILALADDRVVQVACPDGAGEAVVCTDEGMRIEGVPETFEVTAKARGYEFVTQSVSAGELPTEADIPVARVQLPTLEAFEVTEDYATGFEADAGLDFFVELGVSIDTELGPTHAVKFYIDQLDQQPRVFFQNTRLHPLHYRFARTVLENPLSLSDFEMATYWGEDRTALAGTVTYYPALEAEIASLGGHAQAPLAITFFPSDDLTPAQAYLAHRLIEERMAFAPLTGAERRVTYLPAGEVQEAELRDGADLFEQRGAAWMTHQEMYGDLSLQILNPGLAYGTLRLLTPAELETAVVSFNDILVLTELPNWLPVVAGTITEELQTPLAHVNVAARTRGTPNIALLRASDEPRVADLLGQLVRFEVADGTFSLEPATPEAVQSFWDSRELDPVVPVFDVTRDGLPGFDEVSFFDSESVGVKAANLAELSQLLGEQAPSGFAVPFHCYDQFMRTSLVTEELCAAAHDRCRAEGRSTRACDGAYELCAAGPASGAESLWDHVTRLLSDERFQSDTEVRDASLAAVRHHITHLEVDSDFAQALDGRVAAMFGNAGVRIRSSTNAEDLPNFTGAGLYESVTAYASGAQAASSRIRLVWASVWNWRAFEERSYWNIDHLAVRMGCAVNEAFGDEAANGVLITQNIADPSVAGMYVNVQLGEVSVTNPTGGALPEVMSIIPSPQGGIQVTRQRLSSLSPQAPIMSDAEITELFLAASAVQRHFAPLYQVHESVLALDLEFKLRAEDRSLAIKQARPYSQPGAGY